jgi:hypothetical protein
LKEFIPPSTRLAPAIAMMSALGGRAGLEDLRDRGVVHHREGLTFGLEAGDDLGCVHPRLDDLHRDPALDGLDLVALVDGAEAAFAEELEDLEGADAVAGDDA